MTIIAVTTEQQRNNLWNANHSQKSILIGLIRIPLFHCDKNFQSSTKMFQYQFIITTKPNSVKNVPKILKTPTKTAK